MNSTAAVREELLGLPRLHGRQSDGEAARLKLGNKRVAVPTRSSIGSNAVTNNSVFNATNEVEAAGRNDLGLVHPDSPREKSSAGEKIHSMRPKSTPGVSRNPVHPHYRSDTHSAVARRPTTSNPAAPRAHPSDQKHFDDSSNSGASSVSAVNPDYMKAVAELQDENESLRHNIRQLHAKLLEKMRGANKVVGGGQFRVMTSAPGSVEISKHPFPLSEQAGCLKCSSLRGESARLKHELTRVAGANEELKRYVESLEQQQTVWCAERDSQRMEIEQLMRDLIEGNQARAIARADCDQLELQMMALRVEFERVKVELVEKKCDCVAARVTVAAETQDASVQALLLLDNSRERDEEAKRRYQQELEVVLQQLATLKLTADAAQSALDSERERHRSTEMESKQRLGLLQRDLDDQEAIVERLNQGIASLNQKNSLLTEDLARRDQEIADHKRQHLQSIDEMAVTHHTLLTDSQRTQDNVVRDLKTANTGLERQILELEAENAEYAAQIHQLAVEIALKSEQILNYQASDKRDDNINNKTSDAIESKELSRLADQLKQAETSLQSALINLSETQARVDSLQVDVEERDEVIARMRDAHDRALERALGKTLRLCVVAPTVNVHLSKSSSSKKFLTNATTDAIQCRSSPPRHAIQDVVEKEILPFFAKIMAQPDPSDSASPSSGFTIGDSTAVPLQLGVPTDAWLQQLLDGMKQQLADRIEGVYTSLTPSA